MADKKPIISPGSMLNTSEGLLSSAAAAALVQQLYSATDWRVQAACALGLSIVATAYAVMRAKVKAVEVEVAVEDNVDA
jgi:hypothetical protein|tara:strand:- start:225 stop:461 length:237 start_codon:yes stop_codon:yes gene_type:complete